MENEFNTKNPKSLNIQFTLKDPEAINQLLLWTSQRNTGIHTTNQMGKANEPESSPSDMVETILLERIADEIFKTSNNNTIIE